MSDNVQKERYITPIAIGFMTTIVPDFLKEAFDAYHKRDFTRDYWQVSSWEQWYGGAGVALTVSAIEANRNRFFYMKLKDKTPSRDVCQDIVGVLSHLNEFPANTLVALISEVFTVRNVILHSHIYEIDAEFTLADWEMIDLKRTKLAGYGNSKFENLVDSNSLKTKLLGMNVLPARIGFEELFTALLVFDLIVGIIQKIHGKGYFLYRIHQELDSNWVNNLCELLTYYFDQIPSNSFKTHTKSLASEFGSTFRSFLGDEERYFITNTCPKCGSLGFHKWWHLSHCTSCNATIRVQR